MALEWVFRERGAVGVGDVAGDAAGENNEGGFLQVIYTPLDPAPHNMTLVILCYSQISVTE